MFEQLIAAIKAYNAVEATKLIDLMSSTELNKKDSKGYTALHYVSSTQSPYYQAASKEIAQALLNKMQPATINAKGSDGQIINCQRW